MLLSDTANKKQAKYFSLIVERLRKAKNKLTDLWKVKKINYSFNKTIVNAIARL